MFTRAEALALWDDLVQDKDAFLYAFGELVFTRRRRWLSGSRFAPNEHSEFGYFIRACNHVYTREMFESYGRICKKHQATYRIEKEESSVAIIFYKLQVETLVSDVVE